MGFAVFGVDSLPFHLIIEQSEQFPFLYQLYKEGKLKKIQSCTPPVTIPAWSVISTGRDPGELGTYGFYRRRNFSYHEYEAANADWIHYPRIWSKCTGKSYIIAVPQTYPVSSVNGCLISGILTPDHNSAFIWPQRDSNTIQQLLKSPIRFDISNFRRTEPEILIPELTEMWQQKIVLIEYFLQKCQPNDCLFSVLIEPDRINHAFWNSAFETHPLFRPHKQCQDFFFHFYRQLDQKLSEWFSIAIDKKLCPLIISDHGARSLQGSFCINKWLIETGFLKLQQKQNSGKISSQNIDWSETQIWAEGGYVGKLFFNLTGREPQGCYQKAAIIQQLNIAVPQLRNKYNLNMELVFPEKIYQRCAKIAPDAFLLVDDLNYRCAASLHGDEFFISGNDTGPDAVNHDFQAIAASIDSLEKVHNIQDAYSFLLEKIS